MDKVKILNLDVSISNITSSLKLICDWKSENVGKYICCSNVHMCMEVYDREQFSAIVNNADLVLPDGKPIVWAQKLLGNPNAEQVRGQDLMNSICKISGSKNLNIGFYGGSSKELLNKVVSKLKCRYSDIQVTYTYSPSFKPLTKIENCKVIEDITGSMVDVLFVGIGCPKQECWMSDQKDSLTCVMVGVGAAFDFIAGSKKHAPKWMQNLGLEWLFRFYTEPKRLWKRYLKQNPRFIYHFSKQLLKHITKLN